MNFSTRIITWYRQAKRDLPWRNTTVPYQIWLSEIILQQTRVEQGLPYYLGFIKAYPNVFKLAKAPQEEVLKLWQGLGYYSRARNLHETAIYIASQRNGIFPKSYNELIKLKGVGDYTASAIASICYNEPVAVVDGNVYRALSRIFGKSIPINSSAGIKEFKQLAQKLLDKNNPAEFNQAIMEFGATLCKPHNPDCQICPFINNCVAYKQNTIAQLPVKLKKQRIRQRHFNYLVFISDENETLLQQRTGKGIWQNLYEFPLIETSAPVSAKNLVKEEPLKNYLSPKMSFPELFNKKPIVHKLSHQHLHTKFWILRCTKLPEKGVPIKKLPKFPVPALIDKFIATYSF